MSTSYLFQKKLLQGKYELGTIVNQLPKIYFFLLNMKPERAKNAVVNKTDIVIEGFPRSGNTFAVAAFMIAQNREYQIAHHLHAPAQIILAAHLNVPTILLIRRPIDAVTSLIIRQPYLSLKNAFRGYIRFHKRLEKYRDNIIVAPFNQVITDFGKIIRAVNVRFQTSFIPFKPTAENTIKSFSLIEQMDKEDTGANSISERTVARPSWKREQMKEQIQAEILKSNVQDLIAEADRLYEKFTS